jgi:hypothetical protein
VSSTLRANPPEEMSVTGHVREAWRLLLQLPDGERERVTEHLGARCAWSEVEADATAMRRASIVDGHIRARSDGMTAKGRATAEDELTKITADLTPADVAKVRAFVEALREGVVTIAELYGIRTGNGWVSSPHEELPDL